MKEYEGFDMPEEVNVVSAQEAAFELAALFGKPVLFSELRIDPDTLPAGLHAYELGHSDDDPSLLASLQKHVSANFFGTVVSDTRIELGQTRYSCGNYDERYYQPVEAGDFLMDDFGSLTMEQYMKGEYELTPQPEKEIRIIVVEPMKKPYEAVVANTLEAHQKLVGGYIETVSMSGDNVILVCNEEGKLNGLPLNRRIGHDIIAGSFFLCGDNQAGDFASLTKEQIKKYTDKFSAIELYVGMKQNIRHESRHETDYER